MAVNITTQPTGGTWYKGATVRLYCYATSTKGGKITYDWDGTGDFAGNGSVCYVETSSVATMRIFCWCYDTHGDQNASNTAYVYIVDTPTPTVSGSGGGSVYKGQTATLSCSATSDAGDLTYQWQYKSGSTWIAVSGATSTTYTPSTDAVGTNYYRCSVTNTLNGYTKIANTSQLTVQVLDTPVPSFTTTDLFDKTYYKGASPVSSYSVTGYSAAGTLSYRWQSSSNGSSWSNISGATGTSYTPPVTTAGTTYYRCSVTNTLYGYSKTTNSGSCVVTVNDTPSPEYTSSVNFSSATYYVGQSASNLVATSTSASGVISYNWQKSTDMASWSSVSSSAAYKPSTAAVGVTYYRCIVSNTLNGYTKYKTSSSATITVIEQPSPTITDSPSSVTCYRGGTASLSVSATGAGTLTYQWQSSTDLDTWSNVSGATSASYSPPTSTVGVTYYRCIVTSTLGSSTKSSTSSRATVTVADTPTPTFTDGYSIISATYPEGASASTLNAAATSAAGTITYAWQSKDSGGSWTYNGNTTATLTPPTSSIGEVYYRCVVTNTLNGYTKTAISDTAVITVVPAEAPTPSFTSAYNMSNANYYRGDSASALNASATASMGTITYQWQSSSDGSSFSNISGATGSTYTPPTTQAGTKYYRCVVTNTYSGDTATLTSGTAQIVVSYAPAPNFVDQSTISDANYWRGDTATTMNGSATVSPGTVSYQWQSGSDGSTWSNISGATSATYTPQTTTVGSTYYRCAATNTLNGYTNTRYSNSAHITVSSAVTPTFTQNPASASYSVNATATPLSVTYTSGTTPVAYQWQVSDDGTNWSNISGATGSTYTPPTDTANVKYYRVAVTVGNPGYTASATSSAATITITVPAPTFINQPQDATYNVRAQAQPMNATASAPGCTITYQWQMQQMPLLRSGFTDIVGATKATYSPFTAPISVTQYRCIATATNNGQSQSATSDVATITVTGGEAPIFLYTPLPSGAYEYGSPVGQLNGTAVSQDTDDITYQWYWSDDGVSFYPVNGATDPVYTPNPPDGGTYYYYVIATATFADNSTAVSQSNAAVIAIVNAKYDFGNAWRAYLETLKVEFVKLARLEFLQPDGSVAFALDNNPNNARSGAFLQSGNLTVNLQNGQRRTATVTLANLDDAFEYNFNKVWFGQQIRLSEGLRLPNGQDFYLPQGVFYIRDPEEKVMPNEKTVTYHLEDKWSYLNGALFGNLDGIYEIALGTNIFTAIQSVLNMERGNGGVVDSTKPMFTDYYNERTTELPDGSVVSDLELPYTYRNDGDGGTYADIILEMANVLAALVGYDANGRLRIDPSQDDIVDASKPVQWEFKPDAKQFLGATYTVKNTDVYNDIIITGESLSGYGYIAGRAQNLDPSSDTNVNIIGKKTLRESEAGFYTQKQCENLAAFRLKQQTVLQKSISIQSAQMFHINENQIVTIRRPDKAGAPMERHLVTGFTRPIAENGPMQINATSVSDFPVATIIDPVCEE